MSGSVVFDVSVIRGVFQHRGIRDQTEIQLQVNADISINRTCGLWEKFHSLKVKELIKEQNVSIQEKDQVYLSYENKVKYR